MRKIRTSANYVQPAGEQNSGELITVPDQTLTIQQILINHTRGAAFTANNNEPIFNGDYEVPDLRKFDLAEIDQMKRDNQERMDYHKNWQKSLTNEKAKRDKLAQEAANPKSQAAPAPTV